MAVVGIGLTGLLAAVAAAVLLGHLLRATPRARAPARRSAASSPSPTSSPGARPSPSAPSPRWPRSCCCPAAAPPPPPPCCRALLSPVAAAFLGLAAAVLVLRRRPGGWTLGLAREPAGGRARLGCSRPAACSRTRPGSAPYAVLAGLALAALTRSPALRLGGAALRARGAACWCWCPTRSAATCCASGCCSPRRSSSRPAGRPGAVVAPVAAALALWQVQPPYADLRAEPRRPSRRSTPRWSTSASHRVEVVPLRDHGEAAYVAPVVPLARGWSRQIDTDRNPLFYEGVLEPEEYAGWLRDRAVDAVALARTRRGRLRGRGRADDPAARRASRAWSGRGRTTTGRSGGSRRRRRWPSRRCRCWTPTAPR